MNPDEKSFVINDLIGRYDPKTLYPWMPGASNPEIKAALFGLSVDEYKEGLRRLEKQAKEAAIELLKDKTIQDYVENLPFRKTDTVVAFGDGSAADQQGWFAILKYIVELTLEGAALKWVFAGVEGNTSLDLVRRAERDVLVHNPNWVILSAGQFDAQMVPFHGFRTLVSLTDSYENFSALSDLFSEKVKNPLVWITPVTVFDTFVENAGLYEFNFDNEAISAIRELIAGKPGYVADPMAVRFGNPPEAWNYASDGVNASLAGHVETVRAILKSLATSKEQRGKRLGEGIELEEQD